MKKRSIVDLEPNAAMWWPADLSQQDADISIIPRLLKTQDQFLDILNLSSETPEQVFAVVKAAKFPVNLFVKHLSVLVDYGGEPLQRLGRSFSDIFTKNEKGAYVMEYAWNNTNYEHVFKGLPVKGLGNPKLKIDGKGLVEDDFNLTHLYQDIIMLLMHASTSNASEDAALSKCDIGSLLGKKELLTKYVKERYIIVSRITGGATANSLGQLAQKHVVEMLKDELDSTFRVCSNGSIPLKNYDKSTGMPFDVVVSKRDKKMRVGIEISFQVTTNSTIERKSGQAAERMSLMHNDGHKIAYIIDGAGNFQRKSAVSTICKFSDCTVAYSNGEFDILVTWIKDEYA